MADSALGYIKKIKEPYRPQTQRSRSDTDEYHYHGKRYMLVEHQDPLLTMTLVRMPALINLIFAFCGSIKNKKIPLPFWIPYGVGICKIF